MRLSPADKGDVRGQDVRLVDLLKPDHISTRIRRPVPTRTAIVTEKPRAPHRLGRNGPLETDGLHECAGLDRTVEQGGGEKSSVPDEKSAPGTRDEGGGVSPRGRSCRSRGRCRRGP